MHRRVFACYLLGLALLTSIHAAEPPLRIAAFHVDATPPLGSPLANGTVKPAAEIVTPLTARGIVLLGAGQPIVLCAFDWVGIANESHDTFRSALAEAVGTATERVTVHTLHQHDAPGSDFATERLLLEHGLGGLYSNADFDRQVVERLAAAAKASLSKSQPISHVGLGSGQVEKVASWNTNSPPSRCGPANLSPSRPTVITDRVTSAPKSPTARAATKRASSRELHRRWSRCCWMP